MNTVLKKKDDLSNDREKTFLSRSFFKPTQFHMFSLPSTTTVFISNSRAEGGKCSSLSRLILPVWGLNQQPSKALPRSGSEMFLKYIYTFQPCPVSVKCRVFTVLG